MSDTIMSKGSYLVEKNVLVSGEATLRFEEGSNLYLGAGVILRIEGGFIFEGDGDNLSYITSKDVTESGTGLVIAEHSDKTINITRARFKYLTKPLDFAREWNRSKVSITHSEFSHNEAYEPMLLIRAPDDLIDPRTVEFTFSHNVFVDNIGGIYFEDVGRHNFALRFENNFIYGNSAYAAGPEGMLTSPVYLRKNNDLPKEDLRILNNVFDENYIKDSEFDTTLQELNFGAGGDAKKINIPNNYFGHGSISEKTDQIDHFSNDKDAPFVKIYPALGKMPEGMPPVVDKIKFQKEKIENEQDIEIKNPQEIELSIQYSSEVDIAESSPKIEYVGYSDSTDEVLEGELDITSQWLDSRTVVFKSRDPILKKLKRVFFKILGIKGNKGFSSPSYSLGENGFYKYMAKNHSEGLKNLAIDQPKGDRIGDQDNAVDMKLVDSLLKELAKLDKTADPSDALIDKEKAEQAFMEFYRGSYELGITAGRNSYFGDLTGNNIIELTDAKSFIGLSAKYNFTNRITLASSLIYGGLVGDETNNIRGTSYKTRAYKFHSPIAELALGFEYNLNKIGIGDQGRFTPAISAGVAGFYFHPKTMYDPGDGTEPFEVSLYELNTAGLTPDQQYNLLRFSVPVGFHLKVVVKKKMLMDLWASWRYTGFDMLDGVGAPATFKDRDFFDAYHGNATLNGYKKADIAFDIHNTGDPRYYKPGQNIAGHRFTDWYTMVGVTFSVIKQRKSLKKVDKEVK